MKQNEIVGVSFHHGRQKHWYWYLVGSDGDHLEDQRGYSIKIHLQEIL